MIRLLFLFSLFVFTSCNWNELPEVVCVPDEQVFLDLVQPILENNCISCHSTTANRPAVHETYDGVIDALTNYSLKEKVINHAMPPYGSPALIDSDIMIIQKWADCE